MSTVTALVGIAIAIVVVAWIFFVLFGEVTVRRLRKNPATKGVLGIEFYSGWDIMNVAMAFALPRWMNRKLRSSPLAALHADADLLEPYTNRFDRILGRIFFWALALSVFVMCLALFLETTGIAN